MIRNKKDYHEYMEADLSVQPESNNLLKRFFLDDPVRIKKYLRKSEYYFNVRKDFIGWIAYRYNLFRLRHLTRFYNSEIPLNVLGKGVIIWHPQRIIINGNAIIGSFCSLSSGVVIAQAHDKSPIIGDYVELMIDSKVLGGIRVADHVRIGADALVLKDIVHPNTTWGGCQRVKSIQLELCRRRCLSLSRNCLYLFRLTFCIL